MGEYKKRVMEMEEKLIQRAFNEWEIEKMLREMSFQELDELCAKIDAEKAGRTGSTDEDTTTA